MAYQSFVDYIESVAQTVNPTGTFIHGRRIDGSIEYNAAMPQIHMYPFTTNVDVSNGYIETANMLIGFWFQDSPESSNEDREAIISQADVLCKNFIEQIVNEDEYEITGIRTEPQYQTIHGTLSGYALSFQLKGAFDPC